MCAAKIVAISPWLALCVIGILVLAIMFVPLVSVAWIADYSARIVAKLYGTRFLP